jgi:hypothetical protein
MSGSVTVEDPWALQTPPLTSTHSMHRDTKDGLDVIVCTVGKTVLLYDARCIEELHAMLAAYGDWMDLGTQPSQQPNACHRVIRRVSHPGQSRTIQDNPGQSRTRTDRYAA